MVVLEDCENRRLVAEKYSVRYFSPIREAVHSATTDDVFRLLGAENPAGGLTKQIRDMAPLSPLMRGGAFVRETFNPLRGWQHVKHLRNWERGVAANPTSLHLFPKSNSRLAAKRWGFVDSVFFQRISLRTSRWKLRTHWGSMGRARGRRRAEI